MRIDVVLAITGPGADGIRLRQSAELGRVFPRGDLDLPRELVALGSERLATEKVGMVCG